MNQTLRIKVFKTDKANASYCYECNENGEDTRGVTKWDEISVKDYQSLQSAISSANAYSKGAYHYWIVQDVKPDAFPEIFDTAKEYQEWIEKETQRRDNEDKIAKEKRKQASEARKQKQLAKLKQELGVK